MYVSYHLYTLAHQSLSYQIPKVQAVFTDFTDITSFEVTVSKFNVKQLVRNTFEISAALKALHRKCTINNQTPYTECEC